VKRRSTVKIEEQYIKVRGGSDIRKLVDVESGRAFRRIVAGLGWPYAERPGFVVTMGEDFEQDHSLPHSPRHYRVLAEHETSDLEALQRTCNKFREHFWLSSILGNPENPVYEVWRRNESNGPLVNISQPADFEKIDMNLIAQLVRKNTEARKILHFGDSKLAAYLTRFVAERMEHEAIEQHPPLTAFGFALVELELHGHSSLSGWRPDRGRLVLRNRRWLRR
jgi:hypothetical protein